VARTERAERRAPSFSADALPEKAPVAAALGAQRRRVAEGADAPEEVLDLARRQRPQRQAVVRGVVREAVECRGEVVPVTYVATTRARQLRELAREVADELERRPIGGVRVVEHEEERPVSGTEQRRDAVERREAIGGVESAPASTAPDPSTSDSRFFA
jgi:hypothetical protein